MPNWNSHRCTTAGRLFDITPLCQPDRLTALPVRAQLRDVRRPASAPADEHNWPDSPSEQLDLGALKSGANIDRSERRLRYKVLGG